MKRRAAMADGNSREELLDRIEKAAHDYEKAYHGCSRCVFRALQENVKIGDGASLRASTPFAGGVGMRGETCGAVLAGLMALGIVTAKEDFQDQEALTHSLSAGFRLTRKIEREVGSIKCAEIQKARLGRFYDLSDLEQYKEFVDAGGYTQCSKVVGKVARITGEFLLHYLDQHREP
jgi:C_GCAxxG_C_C family probable redox protein